MYGWHVAQAHEAEQAATIERLHTDLESAHAKAMQRRVSAVRVVGHGMGPAVANSMQQPGVVLLGQGARAITI